MTFPVAEEHFKRKTPNFLDSLLGSDINTESSFLVCFLCFLRIFNYLTYSITCSIRFTTYIFMIYTTDYRN